MVKGGSLVSMKVDEEYKKLQEMQIQTQKLRNDQKILMQQQSENEMVKQELALLDDSSQVYKMIGPVLMRNDINDAKHTVQQRLELITGELKKVTTNTKSSEQSALEVTKKVKEMQSSMQAAAVEAAKLAAQEAAS